MPKIFHEWIKQWIKHLVRAAANLRIRCSIKKVALPTSKIRILPATDLATSPQTCDLQLQK